MLSFEWIWAFALLPLPWLFRLFVSPATPQREAALRIPFSQPFGPLLQSHQLTSPPQSWLIKIIALLAWILLVTALARPQWIGDPIELPASGRDLMMAVDLSGSMETRDFLIEGRTVDRLTATKAVAQAFIERREGDRIGLILFGRNAYVQTPLTFDRDSVNKLLLESAIGLAGKETAIGDAIGLAVKRLRDSNAESRVLILLTDGANTAGEVAPRQAAQLAAQAGLKIHTIGIGADEMIINSLFGRRRVNPSRDLDEAALTEIAQVTGGQYFRARNIEQLNEIYTILDQLEPVERENRSYRPTRALFFWPLAGMLILVTGVTLSRSPLVARLGGLKR